MGQRRGRNQGRVWLEVKPGDGTGEAGDPGGREGLAAIWRAGAPGTIGQLRWRIGWPKEGLATVEAAEIVEGERGWGYVSEAVRQLEGLLGERGVRGFAVAVDCQDGLGLFFWLRLGYRPAMGLGPPDGGFWMARMMAGS